LAESIELREEIAMFVMILTLALGGSVVFCMAAESFLSLVDVFILRKRDRTVRNHTLQKNKAGFVQRSDVAERHNKRPG
jgi:hypothetical protein